MNQGDYKVDLQRVTLYFENQLFLVPTKDLAKISQGLHCGPKDFPSSTLCKKGKKKTFKDRYWFSGRSVMYQSCFGSKYFRAEVGIGP